MSTLRLKAKILAIPIFLGVVALAGACTTFSKPKAQTQTAASVDTTYLQDFMKNYIKDMEEQYELTYYGGGQLTEHIDSLDITFSSHRKRSVKNARKTLVGCAEEYLSRVNNDEKLSVFLDHHPIKNTELDLGIIFLDENEQWYDLGFIVNASLIQGVARYKIYNRERDRFQNRHEEFYREALKIVRSQSSKQEPSDILNTPVARLKDQHNL